MSQSLLRHVASSSLKKTLPVIEAGQTVRVSQKIKEGDKERLQTFEGLVIATDGGTGINATYTVRKVVEGVGVEKIFPLHGKTTPKIEVVKQAKVRRSKLYYMRELSGKSARLKDKHNTATVYDEEPPAAKAPKAKAEEPAPAAA
jgi:large subunit ribosomal protein L19